MNLKNKRGITLIALVVTIIVLVIIGGVTLATLISDNGILRQVNSAKITQIEATAREQVKIACSAMRMAVAQAQAQDNSYSAINNARKIQSKLIEVLNSDKKQLTGNFSDGNEKANNGDTEFRVEYIGEDYSNACNDENAKIIYTIGLGQKTVELKGETNSSLKDQNGNDVNINIKDENSDEEMESTAGLYETGSGYTVMLKTWQELIDEEVIFVENGTVFINFDEEQFVNNSSDALSGDLVLPNDGSITKIGNLVYDINTDTSTGTPGFCYCENLTGIILPDSITSISEYSFVGCTALETIEIPEGITEIFPSTFEECISLKTVKLPSNITKIHNFAFSGCEELQTIELKESLVELGWNVFSGCHGLKTITIPESVTQIGDECFYSCTGLEQLVIRRKNNNTINSWENTFKRTTKLNKITLSYITESEDVIEWYSNDTMIATGKIINIDVPTQDTTIYAKTISLGPVNQNVAPGLYETGSGYTVLLKTWDELISNDVIKVTNGVATTNAVPDEGYLNINGYYESTNSSASVLSGDLAFPNDGTVTTIGTNGFLACTNLTGIYTPENITLIDDCAFMDCTSLKYVSFAENSKLTTIDSYAFRNCTSLINITIPNSVTTLGEYVFYNCTSFTDITVPVTITNMGNYAFSNCTGITNATFSEGRTNTGKNTFNGCTSLENVVMPSSLTDVQEGVFSDCKNLTNIGLPESVSSIGENAFAKCGIVEFTIPEKVKTIEGGTFTECENLVSIIIPEGVTKIGDMAFRNCPLLKDITIPQSLTTLGMEAFNGCTSITSVVIPEGITTINVQTFYNCSSLKEVTILGNVTSFGSKILDYCTSLTKITYSGTTTEWQNIEKKVSWDNREWDESTGEYIIYCSDGTIGKDGTVTLN